MVTDAQVISATLDLRFAVDNEVFGVFINGTPISGNSHDGDFRREYRFVRDDIGPLLRPMSTNWLYVNVHDFGSFAALLFSATIDIQGGGIETRVLPRRAGNSGFATVSIHGQRFASAPTSIVLSAPGEPPIGGFYPSKFSDTELGTTFDLRGMRAGPRDLEVTFEDFSFVSVPASFEVVEGGGGLPVLDVIGPSAVRVGRDATFVGSLRNVGMNDIGPTTYEFATDAAAAGVATTSVTGGIFPVTPPGAFSTASGVFRFSSCNSLIFRVLNRKDADNCGTIRRRIQRLKNLIERKQVEIYNLDQEYRKSRCNIPPPEGQAGSLLCRAKEAEYALLLGQLEFLESQLKQENARLRDCESGSSSLSHAQTVAIAADANAQMTVCPVSSWDPNDKLGLEGAGPSRYLQGAVPFPYTVYFENKAIATAAAQDVVITDIFDATLDLSTFALGAIRFGAHVINVPEGLQDFSALVDLRPTQNLLVRVEARVDLGSRQAMWRFSTLDPTTEQTPADPLAGFLPPNRNPPEGEGSVAYTILPRAGIRTGDVVRNGATIVFDSNAPIETPVWVNTFDVDPPQSEIVPLPVSHDVVSFDVAWTGSDVGSGIQNYSVYFTDSGGPLTAFTLNTTAGSARFVGQTGHTYGFYSVARDVAGNLESIAAAPDAVTTILADTEPPSISVAASPSTLWPPNGMNVPVNISGVMSDEGSGIDRASITFVVVDEYGSHQPSGSVILAANGSYAFIVPLEAARRGNDVDGRLYTIAIRAGDVAGNQVSSSTTVIVPHDIER
jgi:hypothetical protein